MHLRIRTVLLIPALCLSACLLAPGNPGAAEAPAPDQVLSRLKQGHPRLLLDDQGLRELKDRLREDPLLRQWVDTVRRRADGLLDDPPVRYEIPDGKRLLSVCRRVLDRAYTLAFVYRLDGNAKHKDRLFRELETAAGFKDWNPSHFLDTAEMTHAFAVAYDWLYRDWSDAQRRTIREAIVKHGLTPGQQSYRGQASYGGWRRAEHNWNQVCNGGLTVGALAVAEEEPKLAGEIVAAAVASVPRAMASYAPDGAWGEGIGYWHYATSYNVLMIAALESALGTDFGLADATGFDKTGLFPIHLHGPTGMAFDFADVSSPARVRAPELFWLAARFGRPEYADYEKEFAAPHPLDAVWYRPAQTPAQQLPRDAYFRGPEVATLRSAWGAPDALFVAFKAGDNRVNHGHLDVGTFVLDALGRRWAGDLGSDNYNLPDYFGSKRWTYYRCRAEGHNTLVINPGQGPDQDPGAVARVTKFEADADSPFVTADLTPAYRGQAHAVRRGLRLADRRSVLVQDEVECDRPAEVWWFVHTPAEVTLADGGRTAILRQQGEQLRVHLLEPKAGRFESLPAAPLATSPHPAGQGSNDGVRKLTLHLAGVRRERIAVWFEPGDRPGRPPEVRPLAEW